MISSVCFVLFLHKVVFFNIHLSYLSKKKKKKDFLFTFIVATATNHNEDNLPCNTLETWEI